MSNQESRAVRLKAFALIVLFLAAPAFAEHFEIELTLATVRDKSRSTADTSPPAQGRHPRPVLHARKGEPLVLQFFMSSNFPHDAIKRVTVHYYIVPEQTPGQAEVPPDDRDPVLAGRFLMDFKPDTGKVGLRQQLHVDKPGAYLVRVQSENSDTDHEHFSALDLVVE